MIPVYVLLALCIAFLWGIQPVIHKHLLKKINSITIMLISTTIYLLAILIKVSFSQTYSLFMNDIKKLSINDYLMISMTSLFTVFLANIIYYSILKDNDTSIVVSLIYSAPIFTLFLSYLFLNERLEPIGIIGIFLVFLGVGCISLNNKLETILETHK